MSGQLHTMATLPLRREAQTILDKRLGWSLNRSKGVGKELDLLLLDRNRATIPGSFSSYPTIEKTAALLAL